MIDPNCVFCQTANLQTILARTDRFLIIADHAPLVAGHTLIIPRLHYSCYGAVPADLDDELATIRAVVENFLSTRYRQVLWFEHGVFHQTVPHAHLHALPLGAIDPPLVGDPQHPGHLVKSRDEVRAWHSEHGAYTYIEEPKRQDPGGGETAGAIALFPANEAIYRATLMALFGRASYHMTLQRQVLRQITGAAQVRALRRAWEEPGVAQALTPYQQKEI